MSNRCTRADEDESFVRRDRRRPSLGVLVLILRVTRGYGLVIERQGAVGEVDDVIADIRASYRLTGYPFGNETGVAARAGAAGDDRNLQLCHGYLSVDSVVRSW
jgi:hypothetical protein